MANAKSTIVRFVEESSFGVTPSAAGQILRVTSHSFNPIKRSVRSGEIVSTDTVADYIETLRSGELTLGFEWTVADAEWTTVLEGITGGAWAADTPATGTDQLQNGTTNYSYTVELEFDDITQYKAFEGCVISSLSVQMTPGEIATGSVSFLAASHSDMAGTTTFTGSTAASTVSPIGVTASGVTTVNEGGGASTLLLSVDWAMTRALTPKIPVGADNATSITRGGLVIEGNVSYDLTDATLFSKFEDHTESSFDFVMSDGTNTLDWNFPAIKYLTAELGAEGRDGSADVSATWGAKDNGSGVMVTIERTT